MSYENLIVNESGATRIITINRPAVMNALNKKTLLELEQALIDAEENKIRTVIITGAGEKSFVAGADIGEMKGATPLEAEALSALGHRVFDRIGNLRLPVVAAVNGFALGGGLELALACDFIYASANASFGLVESKLGLIPGFGGIARLTRRVGEARAKEMMFSAAMIAAEEALRIGLVNCVVAAGEVVNAALAVADKMASKGPQALGMIKGLVHEGANADLRVANAMEQRSFGMIFSTQDHAEGISAFLEKRPATFKGKEICSISLKHTKCSKRPAEILQKKS